MKKFLSVFIAGIMALSLVACSGGTQKQADSGRDRKGRPNDEIVVSMGARIPHEFDPKDRYGMYNEAHITHSTLLRRTPDLKIVGDFAKDYKISEDGLVWAFDLHDDFKFSNGELVTAEDVKFSYEMLKEDGKHWDLEFIYRNP